MIYINAFLKNPIQEIKNLFKKYRPFRFVISGGTATFIHISFAYIFTDVFGIWYLYSSVTALLFGVVVGFILQKNWTFRDKDTASTHIQFLKYGTTSATALLANTILMYSLVEMIDLWYLYAQVLTSATIALGNYFIYKNLIFNRTPAQN